jgi:hypothetical protein
MERIFKMERKNLEQIEHKYKKGNKELEWI